MIPEYLVSFSPDAVSAEEVDCIIIGIGVAGLRAAIEMKGMSVLIACKESTFDSSSYNAQGGIAVALSPLDSPEKHLRDTLAVGCGLNDPEAVKILVNEGIKRVEELISWGVRFDRENSSFHFTRESAHSVNRILHAQGDSTGREIIQVLLSKVKGIPGIRIKENLFLIDLVGSDGEIQGALFFDRKLNKLLYVAARKVLLASGGIGQLYQETTNPSAITGDLQSALIRKGGVLTDIEFYQFHPTTLYLAGAPRFLISESVRGEGGTLVDRNGDPFMEQYHRLKDLAPRDIVSRAIVDYMKRTGAPNVFLDLKRIPASRIKQRFPQIYRFCLKYGLDITRDPIPVRPAAHYSMGGIRTDKEGRTSLVNLFACGEVACTGVHGANRLASNSLLEGLVFGARAGSAIRREAAGTVRRAVRAYYVKERRGLLIDSYDLRRSVKSLMWKNVGIERDEPGLKEALRRFTNWTRYAFSAELSDTNGWEAQNMLILGIAMAKAALRRRESRGAHFRRDWPETDDANWNRHQDITREDLIADS